MNLTKPFVIAGATLAFALVMQLAVSNSALASAGDLDTAFAHDGTMSFTFQPQTESWLQGMAIQPDGKIVAVGYDHEPSFDTCPACIVRFTTHGGLDSTFGTNGIIERSDLYSAEAVVVQPKGRILVGGVAYPGDAATIVVLRLLPDGSPDPTFGTDGSFSVTPGRSGASVRSIDVLQNGETQISGLVQSGGKDHALFLRLLPDGTPDPSFGDDGVRRSLFYQAWSVDVFPSGAFVAVGPSEATNSEWDVVRYRRGGALDPSFGTDGVVTSDEPATSVVVDDQGGVVVGDSSSPNRGFTIRRYEPNGAADLGFAGGGEIGSASGVVLEALAIDADGRIVEAGATPTQTRPPGGVFDVRRYSPSGVPDGSFGTGGETTISFGPIHSYARAIGFEPDGRIVLGGAVGTPFGNQRLAFARLLAT